MLYFANCPLGCFFKINISLRSKNKLIVFEML